MLLALVSLIEPITGVCANPVAFRLQHGQLLLSIDCSSTMESILQSLYASCRSKPCHSFSNIRAQDMDIFVRNIRGGLLTFWVYRILYYLDLCFIKLSILLFYNYFASAHRTFHRLVRGLMVFVSVGTLAMIIASIMMCNPPSDAWSVEVFLHGGQGIHDFKCYDPTILWFFSAGFNLVTDFVIWVLPIPFLLNLQSMPVRRRLGLVAIFSVGILAIVASAIRLWIMTLWTSSFVEQGKQTGNFLIWGQVEQHAGIISASIPFLRPIYRKLFGSSQQRRHQPSPGPIRKLLAKNATPEVATLEVHRTPIIPSPSPTATAHSAFRMSPSPLSPISPISPLRPPMVVSSAL